MNPLSSEDFIEALKLLGIYLPEHCRAVEIQLSPDAIAILICEVTLPECDGNDVPKGAYVLAGKGSRLGWAQTRHYQLVEVESDGR
jgi:hypothetical protein